MENLAYLKGSLADGHIYDLNKRIRIVVRQKNKEWLENVISPVLREITEKSPKILITPDQVHMIYVYKHKDELDASVLNTLMKPLDEIRFHTIEEEISFLRGFFDAEGSIYKGKYKNDLRIIMYQKNTGVLEYAKSILDKLNIRSKIYGPYKNGKNSIFRLIVFGKEHSENFLKCIEPLNKVKYNLL